MKQQYYFKFIQTTFITVFSVQLFRILNFLYVGIPGILQSFLKFNKYSSVIAPNLPDFIKSNKHNLNQKKYLMKCFFQVLVDLKRPESWQVHIFFFCLVHKMFYHTVWETSNFWNHHCAYFNFFIYLISLKVFT